MTIELNCDRRDFLRGAGMTFLASDLTMMNSARAKVSRGAGSNVATTQVDNQRSFGALKQIDAGVLNIGYAEVGPANGPAVILLHGWPYDIYAYGDVAPLLASAGYRVIVPYLRGYGTTRFRSPETFRNGEQLVFAVDTVALMDALEIDRAIVAGYDWGGRAADIMAVLWPERCRALVSGQGYLIVNIEANLRPLPPKAEWGLWFQFYFATERGQLGYRENRHDFNKLIWQQLSPKWNFDDSTYERTAASFENPDHVAVVIHNYRTRLGLVQGDPRYADLNAKLQQSPVIPVPSITIASDFDGPNASGASYARQFSGKYAHRIFTGVGHNIPQEDPQAFAQTVIDVASFAR
jgi:pimeloyl-ACP methyl ester carboxylesterase